MDAGEPDRLLGVSDVAKRLGLHPDTIRRRFEARELQAGNVGTPKRPVWKMREAELRAYEIRVGLRADPFAVELEVISGDDKLPDNGE